MDEKKTSGKKTTQGTGAVVIPFPTPESRNTPSSDPGREVAALALAEAQQLMYDAWEAHAGKGRRSGQ